MINEVRNMKGEIVHVADSDEKWYSFSPSTWLLFGGLVLFNIGCFVNPGIVETLFRSLDVRLWPWWYFLFLAITVAFSVKWFFINKNGEDYDDMEQEAARRFHRMAITAMMVMALLVLLNATNLLTFFYYPLERWMTYGAFSWMALLSFILIFAAIVPIVYFFKEWIVTFWNE